MVVSHHVSERTFQFRTVTYKDVGKTNKLLIEQQACVQIA